MTTRFDSSMVRKYIEAVDRGAAYLDVIDHGWAKPDIADADNTLSIEITWLTGFNMLDSANDIGSKRFPWLPAEKQAALGNYLVTEDQNNVSDTDTDLLYLIMQQRWLHHVCLRLSPEYRQFTNDQGGQDD